MYSPDLVRLWNHEATRIPATPTSRLQAVDLEAPIGGRVTRNIGSGGRPTRPAIRATERSGRLTQHRPERR